MYVVPNKKLLKGSESEVFLKLEIKDQCNSFILLIFSGLT